MSLKKKHLKIKMKITMNVIYIQIEKMQLAFYLYVQKNLLRILKMILNWRQKKNSQTEKKNQHLHHSKYQSVLFV